MWGGAWLSSRTLATVLICSGPSGQLPPLSGSGPDMCYYCVCVGKGVELRPCSSGEDGRGLDHGVVDVF